MSITPIEGDGEQPADSQPGERPAGVLGRLWATLRRAVGRLPSVGGHGKPHDDPAEDTESTAGTLRVLTDEEKPSVPVRADPESRRQVDRPLMPGEQTGVETQRDGHKLRIHDPESDQSYISSDTWAPVER